VRRYLSSSQWWLARKANKAVALKPLPNYTTKQVDFTIVEGKAIDFDPSEGTVKRGNAVCLLCHTSADEKYVKAEAQAGRMGHRLVAVVTTRGRGQGRTYRIATNHDHAAFHNAEAALQELVGAHSRAPLPSPWAFGLSWIPDEPMDQKNPNIVSGRGYGFRQWGQLFNPRQLLALCTFGKWVREAHRRILQETNDHDFAKAVATYLALAVDKIANWLSCLSRWEVTWEMPKDALTGHKLAMVFDYAEGNPLTEDIASWIKALGYINRVLKTISAVNNTGKVVNGSAAALPFPDKHFDAVVIDPPYADNVPYADLADFFYVWLRRIVGDLYPEAFQTLLTPKEEEAVVNPARFGGKKQGEQIAQRHYQRLMQKSFEEIYRVLKPDGMAVVMFTHRSTEAWESLIQSLLDAGLYPTASFPVHTEMEASTHQRGKGAIQSTILMACRRRPENASVGWYAQVRAELEQVVRERLQEFWKAGIRGADFFISAIGPAVGVFGKYRKVMRPDGSEITVGQLLEETRGIVSAFALEQMGIAQLDEPTRFYILYRWAYGGDALSFDEANKLAKSAGAELDMLEAQHCLVARTRDVVHVPIFAERVRHTRFKNSIQQAVDDGKFATLPEIDHLHLLLYLWRRGETELLSSLLGRGGILSEEHPLWRTAQALLEVEQSHSGDALHEEATALAQLLGSKRSLMRQAEQAHAASQQGKLFE
jgi:putative DNA methylase